MCTPVTPAVPYLLLGLQDVQWVVGNSRGARKLARTPHVNQKKKRNVKTFQTSLQKLVFGDRKTLHALSKRIWGYPLIDACNAPTSFFNNI
jgi:hypothetical protein